MHPYDHARSSARIHGGVWQDYYALHAWFDASKAVLCRFTHRALRHHLEGVAEAVAHFGADIRNADSVEVDTMRWSRLVRQFGGLAKVDRGWFYAASRSVISAAR